MKSKIENLILDRTFDYLKPYFYNNPYALRCELGSGEEENDYMERARERALEIYQILFPKGADAIIFDYWIYDWSDSGDAEKTQYEGNTDEIIDDRVLRETQDLRFLWEHMMNYRHVSVKKLKTDNDSENLSSEFTQRNRIVCYADDTGFDDMDLIEKQISDPNNSDVSLVSFENECILSVYDERGCDIVFSSHEKMMEFYRLLEPFFLPYDREEMEKRGKISMETFGIP